MQSNWRSVALLQDCLAVDLSYAHALKIEHRMRHTSVVEACLHFTLQWLMPSRFLYILACCQAMKAASTADVCHIAYLYKAALLSSNG